MLAGQEFQNADQSGSAKRERKSSALYDIYAQVDSHSLADVLGGKTGVRVHFQDVKCTLPLSAVAPSEVHS